MTASTTRGRNFGVPGSQCVVHGSVSGNSPREVLFAKQIRKQNSAGRLSL
jgi:hypothetical protein